MHIELNELDPQGGQLQRQDPRQPASVRVPGLTHPVGLGDFLAAATSALGVKPCGGCQKRKEELNRWMQFNPWAT